MGNLEALNFGSCKIIGKVCPQCFPAILIAHLRDDHFGCTLSNYPSDITVSIYLWETYFSMKEHGFTKSIKEGDSNAVGSELSGTGT